MIKVYTKDRPTGYVLSSYYTVDKVWETIEALPPTTQWLRFIEDAGNNVMIPVARLTAIVEED